MTAALPSVHQSVESKFLNEREVAPPVDVKVVADVPMLKFPTAQELGLLKDPPRAGTGTKLKPLARAEWAGVAAMSEHLSEHLEQHTSPSIRASSTTANALTIAKVEVPKVLPSHEPLLRKPQPPQAKHGVHLPMKPWTGLANKSSFSLELDDDMFEFHSPTIPEQAMVDPTSIDLAESTIIKKPAARPRKVIELSNIPQPSTWLGVSNELMGDQYQIPSPSPPSRRANRKTLKSEDTDKENGEKENAAVEVSYPRVSSFHFSDLNAFSLIMG